MRRGFGDDAILGRCTFCKYTVKEGELKFPSRFARITHGRWICGNCLMGMKDVIEEAETIYAEEAGKRAELLRDAGYTINPKTGRLEKVNEL